VFEQATATPDARHDRFFAGRGDPRQVWALDTTTGRVVHLAARGVDDDVRRACADETLRCPIARCPDPRLVAKGGEIRRHHFAHRVAHSDHDAATIFRAEAAAMLAGWARRYRGAHVSTHSEEQLDVVTVESEYSGRSVELAVTYDRRFDDLERFDAPDRQLLVGHTRALLLPRAPHRGVPGAWWCGAPRLITELMARDGAAVAVNPQLRLAATLVPTGDAKRAGLLARTAGTDHPTVCFISELRTCQLTENGLATPYVAAPHAWQREHPEDGRGRKQLPARRTRRIDPSAQPHPHADPARSPTKVGHGERRRPRASARSVNVNRVLLTAELTADPEHRQLADGRDMWTLRVTWGARDDRPAPATTETPHELTVTAAAPAPSDLVKGSSIAIDGRLQTSSRHRGQATECQQLEVLAEQIEVIHDRR
jgi:hypothetical protein